MKLWNLGLNLRNEPLSIWGNLFAKMLVLVILSLYLSYKIVL